MMHVEIKINQVLISYVQIINTVKMRGNKHIYKFSVYYPEKARVIDGTVFHDRDDGANKLLSKVLASADKKLNGK